MTLWWHARDSNDERRASGIARGSTLTQRGFAACLYAWPWHIRETSRPSQCHDKRSLWARQQWTSNCDQERCSDTKRVASLRVAHGTLAVSRLGECGHQDSEARPRGRPNERPMPMPSESHQVSEWVRQETDVSRVQPCPD